MNNPHDHLFKLIYSDPLHVAGELRAVLSPGLLDTLDLDTLRLEPGSYTEPDGVELRSDLLFSVRNRDGRALLVYLLIEHKSAPDPNTPLQVLSYGVGIWRAHRREAGGGWLPPVIPIVISHAKGGWRGPRRFSELFGPELPDAMRPHLPEFELVIDDLKAHTDEQIKARPMTALARLGLLLLAHVRDEPNLLKQMDTWRDDWRAAWDQSADREVFREIFDYIFQMNPNMTEVGLRDYARDTIGQDAEEVVMTVGQRLIEQGRQEGVEEGIEKGIERGIEQGIERGIEQGIERGIEQGIEKGRQEGQEEGMRRMMLVMLRLKFREVDAAAAARVEVATVDELRHWASRISIADTLEILFDG